MDWNDIKLFLALVRTGTVRGAAAKVGVSHSTVARRIEAFEKHLGVRLFERLPGGYATTPAGEDMLAIAGQIQNELDGLERRILGRDQRLTGDIRVTMADALGTHLLMPHLAEFMRTYPDIDLEVVITYEPLDLNKREADVALRFTNNPPEHLVGRRMATLYSAAYASVEYLKRHDLGTDTSACWIGHGRRVAHPRWVKDSDYPHIPAKGVFESLLLQLEATKAGMGIGMLPCFLGDATSALRRLPPGVAKPNFDLWLLTHRDVRTSARLRVFLAFMAKAVIAHRDLLEGRRPRDDAEPPKPPSPRNARRTRRP